MYATDVHTHYDQFARNAMLAAQNPNYDLREKITEGEKKPTSLFNSEEIMKIKQIQVAVQVRLYNVSVTKIPAPRGSPNDARVSIENDVKMKEMLMSGVVQ